MSLKKSRVAKQMSGPRGHSGGAGAGYETIQGIWSMVMYEEEKNPTCLETHEVVVS